MHTVGCGIYTQGIQSRLTPKKSCTPAAPPKQAQCTPASHAKRQDSKDKRYTDELSLASDSGTKDRSGSSACAPCWEGGARPNHAKIRGAIRSASCRRMTRITRSNSYCSGLSGHPCLTPRWLSTASHSTSKMSIVMSKSEGVPCTHVTNGESSGNVARTSSITAPRSTSLNALTKSNLRILNSVSSA